MIDICFQQDETVEDPVQPQVMPAQNNESNEPSSNVVQTNCTDVTANTATLTNIMRNFPEHDVQKFFAWELDGDPGEGAWDPSTCPTTPEKTKSDTQSEKAEKLSPSTSISTNSDHITKEAIKPEADADATILKFSDLQPYIAEQVTQLFEESRDNYIWKRNETLEGLDLEKKKNYDLTQEINQLRVHKQEALRYDQDIREWENLQNQVKSSKMENERLIQEVDKLKAENLNKDTLVSIEIIKARKVHSMIQTQKQLELDSEREKNKVLTKELRNLKDSEKNATTKFMNAFDEAQTDFQSKIAENAKLDKHVQELESEKIEAAAKAVAVLNKAKTEHYAEQDRISNDVYTERIKSDKLTKQVQKLEAEKSQASAAFEPSNLFRPRNYGREDLNSAKFENENLKKEVKKLRREKAKALAAIDEAQKAHQKKQDELQNEIASRELEKTKMNQEFARRGVQEGEAVASSELAGMIHERDRLLDDLKLEKLMNEKLYEDYEMLQAEKENADVGHNLEVRALELKCKRAEVNLRDLMTRMGSLTEIEQWYRFTYQQLEDEKIRADQAVANMRAAMAITGEKIAQLNELQISHANLKSSHQILQDNCEKVLHSYDAKNFDGVNLAIIDTLRQYAVDMGNLVADKHKALQDLTTLERRHNLQMELREGEMREKYEDDVGMAMSEMRLLTADMALLREEKENLKGRLADTIARTEAQAPEMGDNWQTQVNEAAISMAADPSSSYPVNIDEFDDLSAMEEPNFFQHTSMADDHGSEMALTNFIPAINISMMNSPFRGIVEEEEVTEQSMSAMSEAGEYKFNKSSTLSARLMDDTATFDPTDLEPDNTDASPVKEYSPPSNPEFTFGAFTSGIAEPWNDTNNGTSGKKNEIGRGGRPTNGDGVKTISSSRNTAFSFQAGMSGGLAASHSEEMSITDIQGSPVNGSGGSDLPQSNFGFNFEAPMFPIKNGDDDGKNETEVDTPLTNGRHGFNQGIEVNVEDRRPAIEAEATPAVPKVKQTKKQRREAAKMIRDAREKLKEAEKQQAAADNEGVRVRVSRQEQRAAKKGKARMV